MMTDLVFEKTTRLPRPGGTIFSWLQKPGALERLTPAWERVEILESEESVQNGSRVTLGTKIGPFRAKWVVEHSEFEEDVQFRDTQVSGPFASWTHLHRVEALGPGEAEMRDQIHYRLPLEPFSRLIAGAWVKGRLERLFRYRHAVMKADLEMMVRYGAVRRMRIAVAGGTGLIGRALIPFLKSQGHEVVALVRREARSQNEISWDPEAGKLDPHSLRGVDAVINLAGENIAAGRWTETRKRALLTSRIRAAETLNQAIAGMKHRPFVIVTASAIGFYGSRGEERLLEDSRPAEGFLPGLCSEWEAASAAASEHGVRSVQMRFGMVLTPGGGVLRQLLPYAKLGLPTSFGGGRQWISWISVDDAVGALYHALLDRRCEGPVNAVAPTPLRQRDFSRILARVLRRPFWGNAPAWPLRLFAGEMGEALVLASARVFPGTLLHSGFVFRHETAEGALRHVLGRTSVVETPARTRGQRSRGR